MPAEHIIEFTLPVNPEVEPKRFFWNCIKHHRSGSAKEATYLDGAESCARLGEDYKSRLIQPPEPLSSSEPMVSIMASTLSKEPTPRMKCGHPLMHQRRLDGLLQCEVEYSLDNFGYFDGSPTGVIR